MLKGPRSQGGDRFHLPVLNLGMCVNYLERTEFWHQEVTNRTNFLHQIQFEVLLNASHHFAHPTLRPLCRGGDNDR